MYKKTLIREDKNATKYYHVVETCFKCGGSGVIGYYSHVFGGVCFDCGGSGMTEHEEKELTPEYEAKLQAQRKAKAEKKRKALIAKSAEANAAFLVSQGFNEYGKTYVVLGNTFEIKEALKLEGAKWSNLIGWHFANKPDNRPTVEIDVDEVYMKDYTETYKWNNSRGLDTVNYLDKIREANEALKPSESSSDYYGNAGDKIEIKVTLKKRHYYETTFYYNTSSHYIYIMENENGNVFKWDTSVFIERPSESSELTPYEVGDTFTIKGTIKEHAEYKGVKQTVLTRCKVLGN